MKIRRGDFDSGGGGSFCRGVERATAAVQSDRIARGANGLTRLLRSVGNLLMMTFDFSEKKTDRGTSFECC